MLQKVEVAAKIILLNKDNQVLLLTRSQSDPLAPGEFDMPGGKLNFGESPFDAIKRETLEETGIDIMHPRVIHTWSFQRENTHIVGITFFEKRDDIPEVILSYEHSAYMWLSQEQIPEYHLPERMKQTLQRLFAGEFGTYFE